MLAADFAVQLADAELLVQLNDNGLFVIAEQAGESRGEGFALWERTLECSPLKDDGLEKGRNGREGGRL